MIKTYTAIAAIGLGLICPTPTEPTLSNNTPTKPPCEADVTLLASFQHETTCDVSPPQTIAVRLDDPGDAQLAECDDAGGQVLLDSQNHAEYCINIDY
jgi:hypothetical protein